MARVPNISIEVQFESIKKISFELFTIVFKITSILFGTLSYLIIYYFPSTCNKELMILYSVNQKFTKIKYVLLNTYVIIAKLLENDRFHMLK